MYIHIYIYIYRYILEISSSQLTNSNLFQRAQFGQPPVAMASAAGLAGTSQELRCQSAMKGTGASVYNGSVRWHG